MAVGEVDPAVFSVIRVYCYVHQAALSLMEDPGCFCDGVEELSVFYHSQRAGTLGNECCLWVDEVDCPGDLQVLNPDIDVDVVVECLYKVGWRGFGLAHFFFLLFDKIYDHRDLSVCELFFIAGHAQFGESVFDVADAIAASVSVFPDAIDHARCIAPSQVGSVTLRAECRVQGFSVLCKCRVM